MLSFRDRIRFLLRAFRVIRLRYGLMKLGEQVLVKL